MPPQPGEVSLLTVFADIHYYLGPPSQNPPHHRFDKGSYVYLYHNPSEGCGRLEIANHAGTRDQDAIAGSLEYAHGSYSFKQPCCFTFTVLPSALQDSQQWQLPAFNLGNEKKYMYPLNTVDIYFWHQDGANLFLESIKKVVAVGGLNIHDAPPTQAEQGDMSPVVQKLEQAAITSPYHQGRNQSTSTAQSLTPPQTDTAFAVMNTHQTITATSAGLAPVAYNPAAPIAPEPIAYREKTPPPVDAGTGTGLIAAATYEQGVPAAFPHYQQQHYYTQQQPQSYAENTQQGQISISQPSWQHQHSFSPPLQNGTAMPAERLHTMSSLPTPPPAITASPPPQQVQQYQSAAQSFIQPISASPAPSVYNPHRQTSIPSLQSGPPQQQYATYPSLSGQLPLRSPGIQSATYQLLPQSPGFAPPPPHSPAFALPPLQSPTFSLPPPPQSPQHTPQVLHSSQPYPFSSTTTPQAPHQQLSTPYSTYSYSHTPTPDPTSNPYAIHSQAYIPTAQEAGAQRNGGIAAKSQQQQQEVQQQSGQGQQGSAAGGSRLEARADRLEKGVSRFLKRLDKKF